MRYLVIVLIFLGMISCKTKNHASRDLNLPDSTLISEIILSVIQIDSFKSDYGIDRKIRIPGIYKWGKKDSGGLIPPPPFDLSYDELFLSFGTENNIENRRKDSIFIKQQADTSFNYNISKSIELRFNQNSRNRYEFYLPIFSHDKSIVLVQYWEDCGSLCGYCYQIVLKKINGKWIKVKRWGCGVS